MIPAVRFIHSYVHDGRVGVLVEFGLESQVSTRVEPFLDLCKDIAVHVAGMNPEDVDALLRQPFVKDETITVSGRIASASAVLKERVSVTRFVRWDNELLPRAPVPEPPKRPAVIMRFPRA